MKILFLGDVVGKSGRNKVISDIDKIISQLKIDFTVVNIENAAHGFGINPTVTDKFLNTNIDVFTTGDHIWDQLIIRPYLETQKKLLRPDNYNIYKEGQGHRLYTSRNNKRVLVINLLGSLFINRDNIENPFVKADEILTKYKLGQNVDAIFVDFHAEATSEKMSLAHYLDGRVSAVIGTHTHIPTSDSQILEGGTAFQCDAGMCGDFNSSIGMKKDVAITRFINPLEKNSLSPAEGEATLCGSIVTIDKNGLASMIEPVRIGGSLSQTHKIYDDFL